MFLKHLSHFPNFVNSNLITRQQFPGNELRLCTLNSFFMGMRNKKSFFCLFNLLLPRSLYNVNKKQLF